MACKCSHTVHCLILYENESLKCPYFHYAITTAQILAGNNIDTGKDEVCTNLPLSVLFGMMITHTPVWRFLDIYGHCHRHVSAAGTLIKMNLKFSGKYIWWMCLTMCTIIRSPHPSFPDTRQLWYVGQGQWPWLCYRPGNSMTCRDTVTHHCANATYVDKPVRVKSTPESFNILFSFQPSNDPIY